MHLFLFPLYKASLLQLHKPFYSTLLFIFSNMDCRYTNLVISLSVLLSMMTIPSPAFAANACDFPAIFNFGDSNSDTGGLSAAFVETPWPYGITFFRRPAGRFSDGRLIIDFMAESLGLPFIHPYLDALRPNFSHGVNFATAAATIRLPNTTLDGGVSPFSLYNYQWLQFSQFKNRSQLPYNQEGFFKDLLPEADYFPRALYTFDIGQNDLTASPFLNMTAEEVTANITAILNDFTEVVKAVYNAGARSFWIHNTGPLGCLAYVLDPIPFTEEQIDKAGCAIPWNDLAQNLNKRLNETVVQFRKDFPLAAFTYVDMYSVKYSLFSQPEKYGFENPLIVCCGRGGKYNFSRLAPCGDSIVVNGTETIVGSCENPSVHVNWDGVHYTEAANKVVFDQIINGSFSDPPIPLNMACQKAVK